MLENIRNRPDRAAALEHYRALAPDYDASCWAVAGMRQRAYRLLDLGGGNVVVDVACGTGPMLPELARRVGPRGHVFGIEQSPEMLALARERVAREGVGSNVTLVEAPVEDARLEFEADALLFFYTHDVLQSPQAVANLFGSARRGARVVSAGARFRAWSWGAPLNVWTALRTRRYLTTYNGLMRPWRILERYCPDFAPVGSNCLGTAYLGTGTFSGERPPAA
jgi:ubiquinone/menaquinone biosynthesis C-methylase UbiE